MNIALFSDVHGHLRIVLHMIRCWQIAHKNWIDLSLIAGDLGCFPDSSNFDKATKRWIKRDPEEAGFSKYFVKQNSNVLTMLHDIPEVGLFSAVRCPILFVAGNHEDFTFLHECEKAGPSDGMDKNTFPVDCYKRFHCIKNGSVVRFRNNKGNVIRIAGLWGIENVPDHHPGKISKNAVDRLIKEGSGSLDLLLTHDAPLHSYTGCRASSMISEVIHTCRSPLHLFGHAHPVDGAHKFSSPGIPTKSYIFEDVGFGKKCNGNLEGSMGILNWNVVQGKGGGVVEIVRNRWLCQMRHRSWNHVWPKPDDW